MKKQYVVEILIWIFLILSIAIIALGSYFYFVIHKNTYNLYFDDVDGIIKGSPVRFMGVMVGHVRKLKYNPRKDEIYAQIFVTKKGVRIPNGSKAKVEFTGIVGSKSIEILPPETNEKHNGIIVQNPIRIRDMVESFKMYNRAIQMMDDSLIRFEEQETDLMIKNLAKEPNLESVDKALEDSIKAEQNFKEKTEKIQQNEKNIIKKIDSWQNLFNKNNSIKRE